MWVCVHERIRASTRAREREREREFVSNPEFHEDASLSTVRQSAPKRLMEDEKTKKKRGKKHRERSDGKRAQEREREREIE